MGKEFICNHSNESFKTGDSYYSILFKGSDILFWSFGEFNERLKNEFMFKFFEGQKAFFKTEENLIKWVNLHLKK